MQYDKIEKSERDRSRETFLDQQLTSIEQQHLATSNQRELAEATGNEESVKSLDTQLKDLETQHSAIKKLIGPKGGGESS